MATTTLSTDLWVESNNPVTSLRTDQWSFALTPLLTFSTDKWSTTFYQSTYALSQSVPLSQGKQYLFKYRLNTSGDGGVVVTVGNSYVHGVFNDTVIISTYFTHTDVDGNYLISFTPVVTNPNSSVNVKVEIVSLIQISIPATTDNVPVKEFLDGSTDDGREIFFRADTQQMQLQSDPEFYSIPLSLSTEVERGTSIKAFVSLDDKPFYELEGTVTKGISQLKIHSKPNWGNIPRTDVAQTIQVSYRDGSKQKCRLIQSAVISSPTPIDYAP